MKAREALSPEALEGILNDEKAKGNPRLKNAHGDCQYGGLVRASGRFRGWMGSPDAKRTDGRIPYESTERAERHGRVRCQAIRGIEITDHGTFQIAGLGELHIVGGVRRRTGWSVRELSIQETNQEAPDRPQGSNPEREFVVLMTLAVEGNASAPTPALERAPHRTRVERDGDATERSRDDGQCAADKRQNRWKRRKGRRQKHGSAHGAHTDRGNRQKRKPRNKGGDREWDAERY